MYRAQPKRQGHGTRGSKRESLLHWGNWKKGTKQFLKAAYREQKHNWKIELKKLTIDCDDADIEEYQTRTQLNSILYANGIGLISNVKELASES